MYEAFRHIAHPEPASDDYAAEFDLADARIDALRGY
jgi:hypothetical protein